MARLSSATTAPARRGQGHLAPGYDLGHVAFAGSLDRIELSEPAFVGGASDVRFEHSSAGLSLHVLYIASRGSPFVTAVFHAALNAAGDTFTTPAHIPNGNPLIVGGGA